MVDFYIFSLFPETKYQFAEVILYVHAITGKFGATFNPSYLLQGRI